jgi:hypothetical protein
MAELPGWQPRKSLPSGSTMQGLSREYPRRVSISCSCRRWAPFRGRLWSISPMYDGMSFVTFSLAGHPNCEVPGGTFPRDLPARG